MKYLRSALCVVLLVAAPLVLSAQQSGRIIYVAFQQSGVLTGTVHDETGAVIPKASVVVSGPGIQSQTGTTNELGVYTFSQLPAGTYTIVVTFEGFKESRTEYVNVTAGETTPLEVTLTPQGVTTVETVNASSAAQIETESSEQSGTISEKKVVTYGLNGRNFSQLITLAPGVSNQTGQDDAKVGVTGSAKYSVNGGRVEYNAFDVDGSDVLNTGINASKGKSMPLIVYPSLDAIEEVKVLTSNYGAQYGRSASGTVLVTTKSGGSDFHGDAYEFFRNQFFNARSYFDETKSAPIYEKNDFGATIGGPLYIPGHYNKNKTKTFFFFSEEARFEKSPDTPYVGAGEFNQAVPSLAERGLARNAHGQVVPQIGLNGLPYADFTDVCPGVVNGKSFSRTNDPDCPGTGNNVPNGQTAIMAQPFVNNQIGINGVAQTMLGANLIPLPNSSSGCNSTTGSCFVDTVSSPTTWREELFRLDHNLTQGERLGFRFIHDAWTTTTPYPMWQYQLGSGPSVNSFPSVENQFTGPGLSMVARLDQVLSPTFLNQISVSYTDTHITLADLTGPAESGLTPNPFGRAALSSSSCPASSPSETGPLNYCLGSIFPYSGTKFPGLSFAGNNAEYGGAGFAVDTSYMPWNHRNPTWDVRDSLSKGIGKHTVQVGAQVIYARQSETNAATGADTGDTQGLLTFDNMPNPFTTGNSFADFLYGPMQGQGASTYGRPRYFQQDSGQLTYNLHYTVIEPYVQDDWRVTSRLTVNMGLRMSLFPNWQMKQGQAWNWEPSFFNKEVASQVLVSPYFNDPGVLLNTTTGANVPPNFQSLQSSNNPLSNGLVQCGTMGTPSSCMSSHIFNPAPRIGFAWDPTGSGTTSIRAGYGLFFEHGTSSESNVGSLMGNAPLVADETQIFPQGYASIGAAGPGSLNQAGNPAYAATWPLNVTSIPTKAVWPYTQQWSLSVQHRFAKDTLMSAAYVGSKGTHLTVEEQVNQLAPVPAALNPFSPGMPLTNSICGTYNADGIGYSVGNTFVSPGSPAFVNLEAACAGVKSNSPVFDANPLRQTAPGLGSIYSLQNLASSVYHALQVTVQHTQGPLNLGMAYSYAHSIDSASGRFSNTFVNAYDLAANRASSDFDQRHIFNVNYVYKLPLLDWYAKFFNTVHCSKEDVDTNVSCAEHGADAIYGGPGKLMSEVFSGWNLSGITTFQTGTPFSVINGASPNGVSVLDNAGLALGLGADSYPDRAEGYGCNTAGSAINTIGPLLKSPCSFVAPEGLTQGNAGRNSMNNPGRANFDAALFRQMKVLGERTLEFRAEAFNIFNHTQFRIFDPDKGNTASNTVSCYGGANNSAGDSSCLQGNGFLHPVDARRPRTMQFGMKFGF